VAALVIVGVFFAISGGTARADTYGSPTCVSSSISGYTGLEVCISEDSQNPEGFLGQLHNNTGYTIRNEGFWLVSNAATEYCSGYVNTASGASTSCTDGVSQGATVQICDSWDYAGTTTLAQNLCTPGEQWDGVSA
jgi:hypothetical protein